MHKIAILALLALGGCGEGLTRQQTIEAVKQCEAAGMRAEAEARWARRAALREVWCLCDHLAPERGELLDAILAMINKETTNKKDTSTL